MGILAHVIHLDYTKKARNPSHSPSWAGPLEFRATLPRFWFVLLSSLRHLSQHPIISSYLRFEIAGTVLWRIQGKHKPISITHILCGITTFSGGTSLNKNNSREGGSRLHTFSLGWRAAVIRSTATATRRKTRFLLKILRVIIQYQQPDTPFSGENRFVIRHFTFVAGWSAVDRKAIPETVLNKQFSLAPAAAIPTTRHTNSRSITTRGLHQLSSHLLRN